LAFQGIEKPTEEQFLGALLHAETQHATIEHQRAFRLFMEALSKIKVRR
jgi:hypothetical protein